MSGWLWAAVGVWGAAIAVAIAASALRVARPRSLHILAVGTGLAIFLTHLPISLEATRGGLLGSIHAAAVSLYFTMQTFGWNIDIAPLLAVFGAASGGAEQVQALAIGLMYSSAPLLLGAVLVSFFQTPSAVLRYMVGFWRDTNVFSELNERSLALATSIKRHEPASLIVFTNVVVTSNDPSAELIAQARQLGAVCFKKGILSSPCHWRARCSRLRLFLLGDDEAANAWYAVDILERSPLAGRDATDLYVLATTLEGDLALMTRAEGLRVRVRRVNPARTLVYDWLWRDADGEQAAGMDLFRNALAPAANHTISAAIIGLGTHGLEVLRALTWYCRMTLDDGERVRLRVRGFDREGDIEDRIRSAYPGLLTDTAHAALHAETTISIHGGVDATSAALVEGLRESEQLSFVFISTGDDTRNVTIAVELFRECVRQGRSPQILTISRNSARLEAALAQVRGEAASRVGAAHLPSIHLVGDTSDVFSYGAIIRSELELNGLVGHLMWSYLYPRNSSSQNAPALSDAVESFWASEYNYASSLAVPIHWKARRFVRTPGAHTRPDERSAAEHEVLQRLEHDRWSSFLLSEGFVRGAFGNAYLVRTHPLLVPYEDLPDGEAEKDDNDSRDVLAKLEHDPEWVAAGEGGPLQPLVARARAAVHHADPGTRR